VQRRFALIGHVHTLSDITDLDITGVADNNLLQYDSATLSWTNRTYLALNEIADPGVAPANEIWVHAEDVAGFTALHVNDSTRKWSVLEEQFVVARNTTGSTIAIGTAVYVNGSTGTRPTITPATLAAHQHIIGVTAEAIANNGYGRVIIHGYLTGYNTNAWTAGTALYSDSSGVLTSTEPTHPNTFQTIGQVIYQHAVNGIVLVDPDSDSRHTDGSYHDTLYFGSSLTDRAVLDITGSALTASRTFKFPDVSGTFPTLENTHTVTGLWTFGHTASTYDVVFDGYPRFKQGSQHDLYLEIAVPSGAAPDYGTLTWWDYDNALNKKGWTMESLSATEAWHFGPVTDAGVVSEALSVVRGTGAAVGTITYGNSTDLPIHTFWARATAESAFKFSSSDRFYIYGGAGSAGAGAVSDQYGAGTGYAWIEATARGKTVAASGLDAGVWIGHVRGSEASPSASVAGDESGDLVFWGLDSTTSQSVFARIIGTVETVSASNVAGGLDIRTHSGTGNRYSGQTSRMLFKANGDIQLGVDSFFTFDEHASAPATPASGKVALYAKSDGHLYQKDDAGTETDLTSGTTPTRSFGASWGSSSALVAADCADVIVHVPQAGTITGVYVYTQGGNGSCVIDIWKDTYANFPPTVADTITASAKPTISAAAKYSDTTLTGWTTSLSAGNVLKFHVDSTSTFTNINVVVTYQ